MEKPYNNPAGTAQKIMTEDHHAEVALYREGLLNHVARLMAAGNLSLNEACRQAGVSAATMSRWRRDYAAAGIVGLRPDWSNCGRKKSAELSDPEVEIAQRLYLQTGSQITALRMLASLPECSQETSDAIMKQRSSKHAVPRSIRDQVRLSHDVATYHASPKRTRIETFICPRTLTYLDALGAQKQLTPGDLFERDDMSNNFLCWVPWPYGGDPCSDKYGVRVARGQNLLAIDVASLFFFSFNFLIRLRDSYRADDIWEWIGRTYADVGKPRIGERWERGTWQARKLRGDDALIEAGHTDDKIRLGGMASLGLKVIISQSPTTKIIENRFNFLQRVMSTIPGQIGRTRGGMERETKIWMQCQRGERDPREYFLSAEENTQRIEQSLTYCNNEPVEGAIYNGVPAQIWYEAVAARPLERLNPESSWLFARDKRTVQADRSHIMIRYTNPQGDRSAWWFHHPELREFQGLKIHVYFDEYTPSAGAVLVVAEGRRAGRILSGAQLVEGCPQFSLAPGSIMTDREAVERKKRHMNAVRSEYRATGADDFRWARGSRVDDGAGTRIEVGTSIPPRRQSMTTIEPEVKLPVAKIKPRNEADELKALENLEKEARERGDILSV